MKIIHWTIIFILIVVPFSLVCRNIINTRFLALKDEVRINNAIDTATHDAVDLLVEIAEINGGKNIELNPDICEAAIEQFFNTMSVNYNMPYNEGSKEYLCAYIPAIIIVGYNGFYIYSAEETSDGVEHVLKPKIPYSYEDENGNVINFTLGNEMSIYVDYLDKIYSGEFTFNLNDSTAYDAVDEIYEGFTLDDLQYVTTDLSYILYREKNARAEEIFAGDDFLLEGNPLEDYTYDANGVLIGEASPFHQKRREVITNLIVSALTEEVTQHNSYAQLLGVNYTFNVPDVSKSEWIHAIDDVSILSFIQGIPVGTNQYYNNYALGGSRITRGSYIYVTEKEGNRYYHKESCTEILNDSGELDYSKIKDMYLNKKEAAYSGAHWCTTCKP